MLNIKTLFLSLIILVSLLILIISPKMPKQAVITDSEYGFVEVEVPQTKADIPSQHIGVSSNKIEIKDSGANQNVRLCTVSSPKKSQNSVRTPSQNSTVKNSAPKQDKVQPKTAQTFAPKSTVSKPQPVETPKVVEVKPTQNIENKQPKQYLTEEEEIIAWNHWRSRLQNQVMMDSKVVAPLGTVFKFSFTVDKYGNMSNVKVWSTNPAYSDYAVRMIKPILMSYRNKAILNFPSGTRRIIVNVDGGFTMSRRTQYSSPSDYHDYETVRR